MLIAEYDYDLDVEVQREEAYAAGRQEGRQEGIQEGRQEGQQEKVEELIKRKLKKGKSIDVIAEELEESQEVIAGMVKTLQDT